jgi:hypothetical protein
VSSTAPLANTGTPVATLLGVGGFTMLLGIALLLLTVLFGSRTKNRHRQAH